LNPKRTNDVLRKPDNCKSYGQLRAYSGGEHDATGFASTVSAML